MKVPDAGLYVVILSNNEAAAPLVGTGALAFNVARAVLGHEIEPKPISIGPERLKDFVGVYRIKDDATRAVSISDGKLMVQRTGGPKSPALTAIGEDEFVLADFGIRFRFARGPDRLVNALVVKPRVGLDEVCPKIDEPFGRTH